LYGGGGGAGGVKWSYSGPCCCTATRCCFTSSGNGARGAVRIVWPGCVRSFPSTCVSTY
jgi:hypothetical protein